jgi:hypothetical protein
MLLNRLSSPSSRSCAPRGRSLRVGGVVHAACHRSSPVTGPSRPAGRAEKGWDASRHRVPHVEGERHRVRRSSSGCRGRVSHEQFLLEGGEKTPLRERAGQFPLVAADRAVDAADAAGAERGEGTVDHLSRQRPPLRQDQQLDRMMRSRGQDPGVADQSVVLFEQPAVDRGVVASAGPRNIPAVARQRFRLLHFARDAGGVKLVDGPGIRPILATGPKTATGNRSEVVGKEDRLRRVGMPAQPPKGRRHGDLPWNAAVEALDPPQPGLADRVRQERFPDRVGVVDADRGPERAQRPAAVERDRAELRVANETVAGVGDERRPPPSAPRGRRPKPGPSRSVAGHERFRPVEGVQGVEGRQPGHVPEEQRTNGHGQRRRPPPVIIGGVQWDTGHRPPPGGAGTIRTVRAIGCRYHAKR